MTVASGNRKHLQTCAANTAATENIFSKTPWDLPAARDDELIARLFVKSYNEVPGAGASKVHNLLARNLLIELGLKAGTSRTGDVNNRMDLLASLAGKAIATEVEISNAQIDAPRSVLDSIAVLHGRHKISKKQIEGLIIVGEFPNARSEFWTVLADIESVLKIRIKVITTTAAAILVHNRVKLTGIQQLDGSISIRKNFEASTGRKLGLKSGAYSAFEPGK